MPRSRGCVNDWSSAVATEKRARLSVSSSLLFTSRCHRRRRVRIALPRNKRRNKRSPGTTSRWWKGWGRCRNFEIWQGKRERIADTSIKSWFLPSPHHVVVTLGPPPFGNHRGTDSNVHLSPFYLQIRIQIIKIWWEVFPYRTAKRYVRNRGVKNARVIQRRRNNDNYY